MHKNLPRGKRKTRVTPPQVQLGLGLEALEQRCLLTVPAVVSISRAAPLALETNGANVLYTVTFNGPVSNVVSADFRVTTSGSLAVGAPPVVSGAASIYTVAVSGLRGSGDLRLDLIDDDSIVGGFNVPLGGTGLYNGSFQGQTHTVDQVAPFVQSINRTNPTSATSVTYTVTFSEPVTGVDPSDFTPALSGNLAVASPVAIAGSGSVYTVTVSGIAGNGTLQLNLTDDGTILDPANNRLVTSNAPASFQSQTTVVAGAVPIALSVADVNQDLKPDLITANFFAGNVSVLLGNGDGTFQNQTTFSTGVNPNSVVAADLNGDGKPDLVVTNFLSGNVSVLLGNGDGTFQSQQTFATGINPNFVAVVDANADGKPDLAVTNFGSSTVSVLLGNGNGTFQAQATFATGSKPQSVAVADVNKDGKLDLVVANSWDSNVNVLLGNGDGTFQSQQTFATGWKPQSVAVADINGDHNPDLIVATSGDNTLSVLLAAR
jgi:hypothetical protein